MRLYEGEVLATDWRKVKIRELAEAIRLRKTAKPLVIAVDGRSAGGKTTLAKKLAAELEAALLSTDDFAWWHSYFDWPEMLIENAIKPLVAGDSIDFKPPAWIEKGRDDSIQAAARDFVIVEGVGAGQERMRANIDVIVWVQSDEDEARERGISRDLAERPDLEEATRFWDEWMAEENPFQAAQQTWLVAAFMVQGTADFTTLSDDEIYLS